jgi:hypothetical protein
MNKKKWVNSKIIFTITMVFVLCCFMSTSLWAANAKEQDKKDSLTRDEGLTSFRQGTAVTASQTPITDFSVSETKTDYSNVAEAEYCESWGSPSNLHITRVVVADLDKSSGANPYGYSDFTDAPDLTAHLTQGKTYSISLEQYGFYGYPICWKIWVDYNGDHDFDDPCEEVFSSNETASVEADVGIISVPCCIFGNENTEETQRRMRVTCAYYYEPSPCGYIGYGEVEDYTVNITPNPDLVGTAGNDEIFTNISYSDFRRAQPVTMPEDGTIKSVSMYHKAGSGQMILGVYDGEDSPQTRLGKTELTDVDSSDGWQGIDLICPAPVAGGTNVWLAWVYQSNPGIRYQTGSPGRYQSTDTWYGGMPNPFGTGTQANSKYSIKYKYKKHKCYIGYSDEYTQDFSGETRRAQPFTMPEDGTIESISIYHEAYLNGSAQMILGIYDGEDFPEERIAVTDPTDFEGTEGWQHIELKDTVYVPCRTKIWLAVVINTGQEKSLPKIRYQYQDGLPGAFISTSGEFVIPENFGPGVQEDEHFSIYATFIPSACQRYTLTTDVLGNGTVTLNPPGGAYIADTEVTLEAIPDEGCYFNGWSGDLGGNQNPTTITMNSNKSVTATFAVGNCTCGTATVGNTTIFGSTSTSAYRRAMPFTMPENGSICSVSMYHEGGSGKMILGVYDGTSSPQNRLGVTPTTLISGLPGWQGVCLTSPPYVSAGSTVWLAWVYESNPGIRYQTGSPGRYQSSQTWSGGMPDPFGSGSQTSYIYSIYATYTPN